jgi:hypothetical protein
LEDLEVNPYGGLGLFGKGGNDAQRGIEEAVVSGELKGDVIGYPARPLLFDPAAVLGKKSLPEGCVARGLAVSKEGSHRGPCLQLQNQVLSMGTQNNSRARVPENQGKKRRLKVPLKPVKGICLVYDGRQGRAAAPRGRLSQGGEKRELGPLGGSLWVLAAAHPALIQGLAFQVTQAQVGGLSENPKLRSLPLEPFSDRRFKRLIELKASFEFRPGQVSKGVGQLHAE